MATVTGPKKTRRNGNEVNKLEILQRKRSLLTGEHMDACAEFLKNVESDDIILKVAWKRLEDIRKQLNEAEDAYFEAVVGNLNEESIKEDLEAQRRAKREFFKCEVLYEERLLKRSAAVEPTKETYRLPRLEIKIFDGAPNNWLPFWYQFKRIHEDPSISKADKLQYLHQFTAGKVKDLVAGYPQLEENYEKIFKHVKDRYANDKLLIRFYVREILKIVIDPKLKGSVEQLQQSLETKLRALETLGVTQDKYCNFLLPLVEAALPESLLMNWHRYCNSLEGNPTSDSEGELEALLKFLSLEVANRNQVQEAGISFHTRKLLSNSNHDSPRPLGESRGTASALHNVFESLDKCLFCEKTNHRSSKCFEAKKWDLQERKRVVLKKGACFCCLKAGHRAGQCKSEINCSICSGKHVALLCGQAEGNKEDKSGSTLTCLSSLKSKNSYLPTVLVNIVENQQSKTVRALIDSGCQRSYILENLAKDLELKPVCQESLSNCLFGGVVSKSKKYNLYNIVLYDLEGKFKLKLDVLGEESLCHFVPTIDVEVAGKFPEVSFSDCNKYSQISLVLGADVFGHIFKESSTISREKWIAIRTRLGWVLTGPKKGRSCMTMLTTCLKNSELPSLWELDVLGIQDLAETKQLHVLEEETLEHFKRNVSRNSEGRYCVALPWLSDHPVLPDNREIAERRLKSMTSRLCKNKFVDLYQSVLDEWMKLGIIELVPENEINKPCHYLAHRPVVRMSKETTKVRPVFDASCSVEGKPALNDCLSKGPNLLELIIPLLIKFRLHRYGLVADIEKAFLQIELKPKDRDFLRFLWWRKDEIQKEIAVFRHNRLVFGVCCSPFLLGATITHHLNNYLTKELEEQGVVNHLNESLYVDDCIVSLVSLEEVRTFIRMAAKIMNEACLNLRGWKSNGFSKENGGVSETLVLGLVWDMEADMLSCPFQFDNFPLQEPFTKRKLLSLTNKIYDPLGFLAPMTLIPKLLLQQTWKLKLRWDDELTADIVDSFNRWAKHLNCLKECKVPRWLFGQNVDWEKCSLHVFCDGSKSAYAACVFLRAQEETEVKLQLVLAKGRVAPLKELSIPRMELLGACIGVRLAKVVLHALPNRLPVIYWTDSTVVLSWIRRNEQWNVFVRNRVNEIRASTEIEDWKHVPGSLNPADLPSRGCDAAKLLKQGWWNGPSWLKMDPEEWPKEEDSAADEAEVLKERRKGVCMNVVQNESVLSSFVHYFSSFKRIVRMCAWMLRFNLKLKLLSRLRRIGDSEGKKDLESKLAGLTGELSSEEVMLAEHALLKLLQKECIDMKDLRVFVGLKLFRDENGIIRLRSRLTHGLDEDYFQNPIVLVDHELVRKLISELHVRLGHAGTLTTLAQLRERFFIIKGRQMVKRIVKSCVVCRKVMAKHFVVPEAPLPEERTSRVAAFQVTGVDLGGPLFIRKEKKVWFVLFTCAVYRAVHLELVDSLSTESFIMALRRFLARRGRIQTLFSDQGTNFVGTSNLMKRLDENALQKECNLRRIVWRFNPPAAPWWGGWWERLVGLTKVALRKTLGRAYLNYVELETLLCDIESVINSRPLTYLSEDPKDLKVITPAHFIQDFPGNGTVDLDKIDRDFLGKRAKYIQSVRTHLRERFKKEYLSELLNRRSKGGRVSSEIKVGDVVLVEDHLKKRVKWPLGKVVELIPGRDGKFRTVKLQMETGTLTRPVQRLYPLEVSQETMDTLSERGLKTRSGRVVRPVERLNL